MPTRSGTARNARPSDPPEHIVGVMHATIRRLGPDLTIVPKWGMPWYTGRDLVVLVGAFRHHAGVEFWRGSTISDPDGLLEGTGVNLRHVKLRTLEQARSAKLERLVRRAIALDRSEPPRPPNRPRAKGSTRS